METPDELWSLIKNTNQGPEMDQVIATVAVAFALLRIADAIEELGGIVERGQGD